MQPVTHHVPEDILNAYVAGTLPHAFAVVVAAHLSLCDECRATADAQETLAGATLDALDGPAPDAALRDRTLAMLDAPMPAALDAAEPSPRGIYPAAVATELGGQEPRWRSLGAGIRQRILSTDPKGTARLIYIPGGKGVPDHGHNGLEMTLVLQGSFSDCTGHYERGDVQVVESDIDHIPVADPGPACICLAATDAPLRFNAFIPRMLQGFFRI